MRRALPVFFIILSFVVLAGMGSKPREEVPTPDVDFRATVIDDQDISTKLANVSWEGKAFFKAKRGKGVITIPFEKVKKVVAMGGEGEGGMNARVVLKSGEAVAVEFEKDGRVFGQTTFGAYKIEIKNVKEIVFE
ncbi:MAG: hypothetical protein HY883_07210 [Deltaproteobacteria bacterium]|nr:hypothetical protein [Deltaproteobacteria bacterium]